MTTLSSLRSYVRTQTDTLESDLPNTTIDNYLLEAFNRTINAESQWPFYEKSWVGTQAVGNDYFPVPSDAEEIISVLDTGNDNFRLRQIKHQEAEDQYFRSLATGGYAAEYSIWNDNVYLWPRVTFTAQRQYTVRGYRQPISWITGPAATTEPDCDDRLHLPLCHYAIALAYAQQEAYELENVYMERWQRDVESARRKIMDPDYHEPLVMGPNRITAIGNRRWRRPYVIDAP